MVEAVGVQLPHGMLLCEAGAQVSATHAGNSLTAPALSLPAAFCPQPSGSGSHSSRPASALLPSHHACLESAATCRWSTRYVVESRGGPCANISDWPNIQVRIGLHVCYKVDASNRTGDFDRGQGAFPDVHTEGQT